MTKKQAAKNVADHFAQLRAAQQYDPAEVADGLLGIAQGLEKQARRMREYAGQVRRGEYLADFAYASGRAVAYNVGELVKNELPEEKPPTIERDGVTLYPTTGRDGQVVYVSIPESER